MNINLAIPMLRNRVAPCFEAATSFVIAVIEDHVVVSRRTAQCAGSDGYHRVRLLRVHDVDLVICNGIEGFYFDLLTSLNITVIPDVSGTVKNALDKYLSGKLSPPDVYPDASSETHNLALCDLVTWTRDYFEQNGYRIILAPCADVPLIDLVAEITCPVCGNPVKVAICCGAHTYRTDQEIEEFNYRTKAVYNSRVFIFPGDEKIARHCREYGIELVRPFANTTLKEKPQKDKIPILRFPVEGHKKAVYIEEW